MLTPSEIKSIQQLSDDALLSRTKALAHTERETTLKLLHHLREVNRRKLFAVAAYGSLSLYLQKELGYSEQAASRRISAMHLLNELPEIEAKVESGELSMSVLVQANTFFIQEEKLEHPLARDEKREIVESLTSKTTREVARTLMSRTDTPELHYSERVRAVTQTHSELKMLVTEETISGLQTLKDLLAHKHPNLSYGELIAEIAKVALKELNPARAPKRKVSAPAPELKATRGPAQIVDRAVIIKHSITKVPSVLPAPEVASKRKAIPASVEREVFQRDGTACTYRDGKSGRVCGSPYMLELHHLKPWAKGGADTADNLTVRCFHHNQRHAIEDFGFR